MITIKHSCYRLDSCVFLDNLQQGQSRLFDRKLSRQHKNDNCTYDCSGVAGCDGKFYCNECEANRQGIKVKPFKQRRENLINIKRMRKVNLILSTIAMTAIMFTSCGNESSKNNYPSKEVTIGKQVWMTENLNVNKFRNGDLIPEAKTDEEWKKAGEEGRPAWCYYDNKSKNGDRYGKLYNWYAVNDPRGLAPVGWKIPTDEDWSRLTDYLEHPCVSIGTVLKFTDFWDKNEDGESGNGINACGFAALPGGSRYTTGMFGQIGRITAWWSSTESGITNDMGSCAWIRLLSSDVSRYNWQGKGGGLSVRCIRD